MNYLRASSPALFSRNYLLAVRKIIFGLLAAVMMLSSNAWSLDTSGEIKFTSNYVWRGQTQSQGLPSVQGGFDFQPIDNFGLIVGVWGSSVSFPTRNACSEVNIINCTTPESASIELNALSGLHFSLGDYEDLSISFLLREFSYPGSAALPNWREASAEIVLGSLRVSTAISDDYLGKQIGTQFGEAELTIGFAIFDFIVGASIMTADSKIFAGEDLYGTVHVASRWSLGSLNFTTGAYYSTINSNDVNDDYCYSETCGTQAYVALTKKF